MKARTDPLQELFQQLSDAERRAKRNPPGLKEIAYRLTDYHELRRCMRAGLDVVEVCADDGTRSRPLAGASLDPRTDWMVALIDAWAVVGDILTFYQERIANEGYIGTALEPTSSDLLVRMLGVRRGVGASKLSRPDKPTSPIEPQGTVQVVSGTPATPSQLGPAGPVVPTPGASTAEPLPASPADPHGPHDFVIDPGAAAVTDVAFQLLRNRATGGRSLIRAGTPIRSHLVDGSPPVVFETGSDLSARIEYNEMPALTASTVVPPRLTRMSSGLYLAGTSTGLRPGSSILIFGILIVGDRASGSGGEPVSIWLYGTLATVEPNQALGCTLVTWTAPGADGTGGLINQAFLGGDALCALNVFGLARSLSPFGHDARPLSSAPLATQIAHSTGGGVSFWDPAQKEPFWVRDNDGLPTRSLSAVAVGNDGMLWIGGAFGVAFLPLGGQGSWTLMNSGLGSAEVISLTVADDGALWAGTSTGQVFRTSGAGTGWSAVSGSFKVVDNKVPVRTSLPRTPISSVQPFVPPPAQPGASPSSSLPPAAVLVGTGLGVFGNKLDGNGWSTDNASLQVLGGSGASSGSTTLYTSSPLVDLRVLGPASSSPGENAGGYAVAATSTALVAFAWSPFDDDGPKGDFTNPATLPPYNTVTSPPGEILEVIFVRYDDSPGLLVLTSRGPYRWDSSAPASGSQQGTGAFVPVMTGLKPKTPLRSIAAVAPDAQPSVGGIAVGNDGASVRVLSAKDWEWKVVEGFDSGVTELPTETPSIATRIAAGSGGVLLATAPLVLANEWPGFDVIQSEQDNNGNVESAWIDADARPFDLPPGSWVVLVAPSATPGKRPAFAVFKLAGSGAAYRDGDSAYGQPGRVFRLFMPVEAEKGVFDPRSTTILVGSFALDVFETVLRDDRPVQGDQVDLAGIVPGLDEIAREGKEGDELRPLAFAGRRPRLCVTKAEGLWSGTAQLGVSLVSSSGVVTGELSYSARPVLPASFGAELSQGFVSQKLRDAFTTAKVDLPADARVTTLEANGRWMLASSGDPAAPVYLLISDISDVLRGIGVIEANTIPIVMGAWPDRDPITGLRRFQLSSNGVLGSILLADDQWTVRPPLPSDPEVSEVKRLRDATYDRAAGSTRLTLERPLTNAYASSTLHVSANVVRASQGETVSNEILGNGNSGVANQTFTLKRAPLTFLPVPPPEYRRSTLTIQVNKVEWQQMASFAGALPTDRVYTVAIDQHGRASVTFGDGTHGARLPTGEQNVVATYRVGLGVHGDVAAGTLDVLLTAPPGVRSATNPIPATCGVDPTPFSRIRDVVPRAARAGNRVVTLGNYADLASGYPGVRHAVAARVRAGRQTTVYVTVAFDPSVAEEQQAQRVVALTTAIAGAQVQPPAPVSAGIAQITCFQLSAVVRITSFAVPRNVASAVFDALFARWSAGAAGIGEDVSPEAIEAVIQAVSGVEGARVTALWRSSHPQHGRRTPLRALQARHDAAARSILPAEMLALDSASAPALPTPPPLQFVQGGAALQIVSGTREVPS